MTTKAATVANRSEATW